jgi:hypothetical protein
MIRLGVRLTVAGGREAVARLALITIAVAIGVGLLLTTLAGINAVNNQNARYAWLETGYTAFGAPTGTPPPHAVTNDRLWWLLQADYFEGKEIGRVDVAAAGPTSPIPPGISRLPGPGEFYASPALSTLLRNTPAAQLAGRFPGTQIGTIGSAALPAPNSLVVIIGHSVGDLSRQERAVQVTSISTTVPSNCDGECVFGVGIDARGITLILSVVAAALLFPVLIFIAGATRLSAASREQRFAAMRLVGATPRQISVISTVESSLAAIAGVVLGFGVFFAFRPVLAKIPFTGDPFFTTDLSLSLTDVLIVVLGIPAAAAVAARFALRRVSISPLGVTRRVTPQPPRAWRVIPLLAGVAELGYLAYFSNIGRSQNTNAQAYAYLAGVFLIMTGLVVAGPWLTMLCARLMARRARRPATLIAGRRLADNPQAGFRAVSGLVLAVFVGTCALGIITTIVAYNGGTAGDSATSAGTVVDELRQPVPGAGAGRPITSIANGTRSKLTSIPGVTGLAVIRDEVTSEASSIIPGPRTVVSCAEVAVVPALGHCPAGAQTVDVRENFGGAVIDTSSMPDTTWPVAAPTIAQLQHLPIYTIVVGTDGSSAAVEQVRTVLDLAYPNSFAAQTVSEIKQLGSQQINGYQQLARVVILTSLPIAGCSLAVAVAGGLAERRRPFSLLRLTGTPLRMLRRVVTLEAAAPLLITAVVSAGAGLLAAQLFLHAQLRETLQPPSLSYYLLMFAGLVLSLAVIASTLPLLRRITGPEVARND